MRIGGYYQLAFVALLWALATSGARAADREDGNGRSVQELTAICDRLNGQTFEEVTIRSTRRFESGAQTPVGFCRLLATRPPYLDIEVDVPDNWSGRLLHQGGAGLDGYLPAGVSIAADGSIAHVSTAISQKAAIYVASNGGNRADVSAEAAPAVWASGTASGRASAEDYAYRSLGTTIIFAKQVAKQFYGKVPNYTYFNGCSNGGRNAYIAAERWPGEYDGIVAGCETMDMAGQTAMWLNLGSKAGTAAALRPAQYSAAFSAALKACDAEDGIADGVMARPIACKFDPATLKCPSSSANTDSSACLSVVQVATLRDLLSPLISQNGATLYAGYSWADFGVPGPGGSISRAFGMLGGVNAFLATGDTSWLTPQKQATFTAARDYQSLRAGQLARGMGHNLAAIAAYVESGKKLLSWHVSSDNLLSPKDHARNFAAMTRLAQSKGLVDPRADARLFIVPAAQHGAGARFEEVDWLSAIIDWVEDSKPPTQLVYSFSTHGVIRTIPVCEYPSYPRYKGHGDQNSAGSFVCTLP
ncbi:MAG TPA: tannase/feruloyl esterase family alpha/beta hydrolase [Steroidobacteraceae bacterium]|nr:tannase/feruloyl esterase family alpha/beta hydrolase [Steroidobacteraceae bacterium]